MSTPFLVLHIYKLVISVNSHSFELTALMCISKNNQPLQFPLHKQIPSLQKGTPTSRHEIPFPKLRSIFFFKEVQVIFTQQPPLKEQSVLSSVNNEMLFKDMFYSMFNIPQSSLIFQEMFLAKWLLFQQFQNKQLMQPHPRGTLLGTEAALLPFPQVGRKTVIRPPRT